MTTDHRATGAEWAEQHYFATNRIDTASPCIIELLNRVEALELALRAQTGSLTESEQASLGVVPVSVLRGAVRHGVDLAVRGLRKRPGSKTEPAASLVCINDYVSVRLTAYGRNVISCGDLVHMETDADGWTRIQMHCLMRIFGPHIWSEKDVFERNEIKIYS
jgi:hypothetical protein